MATKLLLIFFFVTSLDIVAYYFMCRDMTQFQRRYLTLMLRRSAILPTFLLLGVSTLELLVVQKLQLPNEQAEVVLEPGAR
jgi:hypothetical protein